MLTNILGQMDTTGGSHVGRVEALATAIGKNLQLERNELHNLQIASLLHHIGVFGMPDRVRSTPPWRLSGAELKTYYKYPVIGATLLSEVPGAEKVVDIIHQHAENFDGSGFPRGFRGSKISLLARIIRIADGCATFVRHASDVTTPEQVRAHLIEQKGHGYDPEIIGRAYKQFEQIQEPFAVTKSRSVQTIELRPGLILAEDLHDEDGHFLARKEAQVSETMLPHLQRLLRNRQVKVLLPQSKRGENSRATRNWKSPMRMWRRTLVRERMSRCFLVRFPMGSWISTWIHPRLL